MPRLQHFVNGEFVESAGQVLNSVNPSDPDQVIAQVPVGTLDEVKAAVNAAESAFKSWSNTAGPAKAAFLYKWAAAIEANKAELTQALVDEVGKPFGEAGGEVGRCVALLQYFAGECVRTNGDVIPALVSGSLQYSLSVPIGPVALITPWNFPQAIPLWKALPALAAGCTVVLKPSEMSGYCAELLAKTAEQAGVPKGVFNVIQGDRTTGAALIGCQEIKAVSFTGSAAAGKIIAGVCSDRNIKCQTEMGGKNAAIVLADADLDKAASLVAQGAMRFAGQKCTATSRVIVVKEVKQAFLEKLKSHIEGLALGLPNAPATALGPVISEASYAKLTNVISELGDRAWQPNHEKPAKGWFVPSTLVEDAKSEEALCQNELFGPVLAVIEATDVEDAIEKANSVEFGLSAALFTSNIANALTYIHKIEAGMVRVNGDTTGVDPHAPFGGMKGSSSHSREQGTEGIRFYQEIKTVQINP